MRILLSGCSGLIGRAVVRELRSRGHDLVVLVRRPPAGESEVYWDARTRIDNVSQLEGIDAAIHLAGRSVACRWNAAVKEEIRSSRLASTRLLVNALAGLQKKPHTFLCASAIGFYGDRGEEPLTEQSPPGSGFLAQTCLEWETAAQEAQAHGIRTVCLRFGQVLSPEGGALQRLLPIFKWGLGGPIGTGRMWWSWILLEDAIEAILFLLEREDCAGAFNIVSPNPVRNREFAHTLGRVLRRPAIFPVPAMFLRALFGEMAREVLLASARVFPERLKEAGFQWRFSDLREALRHAVGGASG
ncbi:TIGR01777 family oxidoreductase [Thermogutta sp.]|uniref:TIGR01777 family oxidoreductase n=2 Tax=Thermogutta sp. TaxID=1962930 RepID=UPI00322061FA